MWDYNNQEQIESGSKPLNVKKILNKLGENWAFIMVSVLIACLISFSVNRYTTPIFIVESTMLIKAPKEITNNVSELLYGEEFFGRNASNIANEAILLKSGGMVRQTLKDLELDVSYFHEGDVHDVELYKNSPIKINTDSIGQRGVLNGLPVRCIFIDTATYRLEVVPDPFLTLKKNQRKESVQNLLAGRTFKFGEWVSIKNTKFKIDLLNQQIFDRIENRLYFTMQSYDRLTKEYKRFLSVDPVSIESSILRVSIRGSTPEKLIDFVNQLILNFIKSELDQKDKAASLTIDFINNQILFMSDSLKVAEDQLESFKSTTSGVNLSGEAKTLQTSVRQLEREKNALQLNINYLNDLKRLIDQNSLDQLIMPSSVGITDAAINNAVSQLMDLQLEIRVFQSDKNLSNPYLVKHKQNLDAIRYSTLENVISLTNNYNVQIEYLQSRIDGLRSSVRSLPKAERELVNITRTYELNESLYLFLLEKKASAGIAKASNTVDYRVIDSAEVKGTEPVSPSPTSNYTVAVLLGLIIPSILILVYNALSNKVKSKEDVQNLTSIPILGQVARNTKKINIIDGVNSKSALAESLRSIRSNLRYIMNGQKEAKVFLITSSVSGEGKTFCSNNLGYLFSNFGKRVVLINCDMRKPDNYEVFGVEKMVGLSDYLSGMATLEEVVQKTNQTNLSLITSGGIPPNPSELLINGRIQQLIEDLKQRFDYIIIDTPPIGLLADGIELLANTAANLFVVRQNYTLKRHLEEVQELYDQLKLRNVVLLLNDVNFKKLKYGYGYYEEETKKKWWQRAKKV